MLRLQWCGNLPAVVSKYGKSHKTSENPVIWLAKLQSISGVRKSKAKVWKPPQQTFQCSQPLAIITQSYTVVQQKLFLKKPTSLENQFSLPLIFVCLVLLPSFLPRLPPPEVSLLPPLYPWPPRWERTASWLAFLSAGWSLLTVALGEVLDTEIHTGNNVKIQSNETLYTNLDQNMCTFFFAISTQTSTTTKTPGWPPQSSICLLFPTNIQF